MADDYRHNGGPPIDWRQYGGFIVEAREARNHHLVGYGRQMKPHDPDRGFCYSVNEAWRDLQHECKYKDGFVMNGGHKMLVKRGELIGAISWLAARWNWSPKTVRGFLDKLEKDEMISRFARSPDGSESEHKKGNQNGNQSSVISICNYDKFQGFAEPEWQSEGQSRGNQGAIEGQSRGNIYKEEQGNKGTKEQEDSPPTPKGGEAPDEDFPAKGSSRQIRAERAKVAAAELEQAVETFNKAARHFGFTAYTARTADTDKRLARRLEAVGGHEQFRAALLALRVETPFTRFLLGKVAPRDGERTPFKLDIHALLQTKGNLGDVLQRLLQAGQTATVVAEADQKQPWATWDEAQWRVEIKQHANGIWPTDKIGFWPGHPRCAAPPGLVAAMQTSGELAEYDDNGMKKRGR